MTTRVGFLGAGLIATFHSKMLQASGADVERAGVYDPDTDRAEAFVARAGGTVVRSEDEVLSGCDAIYICTWTSEHPRLVEAALERNLAVFCEKPLGVDLSTATAMTEAMVAAGVTNQVGLVLRFSPAFDILATLIDDPGAGEVLSVVMRDDQHLPTKGRYASTWRGEVSKAGAGVLLEHSIHDLDLLDRLFGPILSISARSANRHGIEGIEDVVSLHASTETGATVSLTTVWHDLLSRPGNRSLEIHCERGFFTVIDDWFGPVSWEYDDGRAGTVEGEALLAMAADRGRPDKNPDGEFIAAVAEKRPAFPDFGVALRAHELVDAAYRSAAADGAPISCS